MKNTKTELKNTIEGIIIDNRLVNTEEWISELEDRMVGLTHSEKQKESKFKKIEDSISKLCSNIKRPNICIIGIPEEEEREKVDERIFEEIMAENFSNLRMETDIQV